MTQSAPERSNRRRMFFGSAFGNFLEWYEFGIYGFLAVYIGRIFFPDVSDTAQLLNSFAIFGASFFVRPLGGMYFGPMSDRLGRKRVLLIVLTLMGVSTTAIGLLPGFDSIGVLAPVLLVVFRLLQGFSAGGEFGANTTFIAEHAAPGRRGLSGSLISVSGTVGVLGGAAVVYLLTLAVGTDAMYEWAWRIPFLLAAPLGLFGIYIRLALEDTPEFRNLQKERGVEKKPFKTLLEYKRGLLVTASITALYGVSYYYVATYLSSYFTKVVGFTSSTSLLLVLTIGTVAITAFPIAGWLSDVVGRRPVLLGAAVANLVVAVPVFHLLDSGSMIRALFGGAVLAAGMAFFCAPSVATMAEAFPTEVRATGISISFNLTIAIFGGMAPFIATYLIDRTENSVSPSWYLMLVAVIATVGVFVWRPDQTGEKVGGHLREGTTSKAGS